MQEQKTAMGGSLTTLFQGYEDVRFYDNPQLGFTAIIAVHDTTLGPSLGGCRRMLYPSLWAACVDVSRLARGMTYKAALTDHANGGLPLGGGKCVMIPRKHSKQLRNAQYRALGAFIESMGGKYISAEDVGTSVKDVEEMAKETKFVSGNMKHHPYHGDPSPYTALGVFAGMLGALRVLYGPGATFDGRSVYVEGIGKVGFALMKVLYEAGATLFVSNRTSTVAEQEALLSAEDMYGATNVPLKTDGTPIVFPYVQIYAPCALGGVVSEERIYSYPFGLSIIAGSANNVLLEPARDGALLRARKIVYAPDYVINNRGLWDIYHQLNQERSGVVYDKDAVLRGCKDNEALIHEIVSRALHDEKCPHIVADEMAEAVIEKKKYAHLT